MEARATKVPIGAPFLLFAAGLLLESVVFLAGARVQVPASVLGGLDAATGEVALYRGNSFSSADAILSYVQWGTGDHERASVAAEAGLWPSAEVTVTPDPALPSIEAGGDPTDPELWG